MTALFEICEPLKLVFVTGKGGIGKSLLSASLALHMQKLGKRVLLVQQSSSDHLGPLLGCTGVGHEEVMARPDLGVVNFTAGGNFRDFVVKHLKHGALFESIISNKIVHGFFAAIPGFGELMLLGRLYYTLNLASDRPDLVIVDSYASGHFMSLMTTPDAVLESGLAGPIANETKRVKDFLMNGSICGTVVVGVPEELVVSEMLDFIPKLQTKAPVKVAGVVFNRDLSLLRSLPQGGDAASRFLKERLERQAIANEFWRTQIEGLQLQALKTARIPELGFIEDPLSDDVVAEIVGLARRAKV